MKRDQKHPVSVVIPACNPDPAWLNRAVESVFEAGKQRCEVIIVDDGSSVEVAGLVKQWSSYPLSVYRQARSGSAAARNLGIKKSGGAFVAFLDADDVWLPDKLDMQLERMASHPEVGLCHTGFQIIDEKERVTADGFGREVSGLVDLVRGSCILTSSVLVRRSVFDHVGLFDETLPRAQDWDLFLRIVARFPNSHIDRPLVYYRFHGASATRDFRLTYRCAKRVVGRYMRGNKSGVGQEVAESARYGLSRLRDSYGAIAFNSARSAWASGEFTRVARDLFFTARVNPRLVGRAVTGRISGRHKDSGDV